jgi:hypothetical protein
MNIANESSDNLLCFSLIGWRFSREQVHVQRDDQAAGQEGESGTGKLALVRAVHRRRNPGQPASQNDSGSR